MTPTEPEARQPGTLWVCNMDWPAPGSLTPRCPAGFGRLAEPDAAGLARAMRLEDPASVLARFAAGRRCYAALVDGAIAAYGWFSLEKEHIGEMRVDLSLQAGEGYIWDCATLPEFRRQRLYTSLLRHMVENLFAEGLCRVWIATAFENMPSQSGVALAGFLPVADVVVERVLGVRRAWVRGRPGAPDAVVQDARRAALGDRDKAWLAGLSASTAWANSGPGRGDTLPQVYSSS